MGGRHGERQDATKTRTLTTICCRLWSLGTAVVARDKTMTTMTRRRASRRSYCAANAPFARCRAKRPCRRRAIARTYDAAHKPAGGHLPSKSRGVQTDRAPLERLWERCFGPSRPGVRAPPPAPTPPLTARHVLGMSRAREEVIAMAMTTRCTPTARIARRSRSHRCPIAARSRTYAAFNAERCTGCAYQGTWPTSAPDRREARRRVAARRIVFGIGTTGLGFESSVRCDGARTKSMTARSKSNDRASRQNCWWIFL